LSTGVRVELSALSLFGTEVSDAGLQHLAAVVNLDTLDLGNTRVTDAGVLRAHVPLISANTGVHALTGPLRLQFRVQLGLTSPISLDAISATATIAPPSIDAKLAGQAVAKAVAPQRAHALTRVRFLPSEGPGVNPGSIISNPFRTPRFRYEKTSRF
jgi:hypothetical protein